MRKGRKNQQEDEEKEINGIGKCAENRGDCTKKKRVN